MIGLALKNQKNYNNSPFESLNAIKKQFHFNSPSDNFDPMNKLSNYENIDICRNPFTEISGKEDLKNIQMNLNENKYSDINNNTNFNSNSIHKNNMNKNFNYIIDNENCFSNNVDKKNEIITEYYNQNHRINILKTSDKPSSYNKGSNYDENYSNLNTNKTQINNLKRIPLGNSEMYHSVFNNKCQNITLNITPENKRNKSNLNDCKNLHTVNIHNKGYSFGELQYMDKENNPPIPRESSRFKDTKEDSSPIEIDIELGISHLNSDQNLQRTLEIPISIDVKDCYDDIENIKNDSDSPLVKEYLIIFNTLSLDFDQIIEFLRIAAGKMNTEDKLYSNIFSNETWFKKGDLEYLINLENKLPFFQNINYLNTEGIIQAIDFCVEISLENNSNIFSVIIINELKDFNAFNCNNVKEGLCKIAKKLNEKRVLMVKNFSINSIILKNCMVNYPSLEDKIISESEKLKFINFFKELTNLTLGCNYIAKVKSNLQNF